MFITSRWVNSTIFKSKLKSSRPILKWILLLFSWINISFCGRAARVLIRSCQHGLNIAPPSFSCWSRGRCNDARQKPDSRVQRTSLWGKQDKRQTVATILSLRKETHSFSLTGCDTNNIIMYQIQAAGADDAGSRVCEVSSDKRGVTSAPPCGYLRVRCVHVCVSVVYSLRHHSG